MKRVLQVVDSMGMGGIQAFIMNVYRSIDRAEIQFDFLLHHKLVNSYDDEIRKLGGRIYYLPARNEGIIKNRKALDAFFTKHTEYNVVHQHESSLTYIEPLKAAKEHNVAIRIIHSHSTRASGNPIHTVLHKMNKRLIKDVATHYFACGKLAGEWMFSGTGVENNVKIINNGIDVPLFSFNENVRKEVRNKLNVGSRFVIGNVGRFSSVKNHEFLIDVFVEFLKINANSMLVLVGDGELKKSIIRKVNTLNISEKVVFLGMRKDVNKILQACDYVVIPSLYEGFPVTVVEALASGVPLLVSDTITQDVLLKKNIQMMSLKQSPASWAKAIKMNERRIVENTVLFENGFDINSVVKYLSCVYSEGEINE